MELINLNNGGNVAVGKLPYGTTRDIPIKLGNKLYCLDVQKLAKPKKFTGHTSIF